GRSVRRGAGGPLRRQGGPARALAGDREGGGGVLRDDRRPSGRYRRCPGQSHPVDRGALGLWVAVRADGRGRRRSVPVTGRAGGVPGAARAAIFRRARGGGVRFSGGLVLPFAWGAEIDIFC